MDTRVTTSAIASDTLPLVLLTMTALVGASIDPIGEAQELDRGRTIDHFSDPSWTQTHDECRDFFAILRPISPRQAESLPLGALPKAALSLNFFENGQKRQCLDGLGQLNRALRVCVASSFDCCATYVVLHSHVRQFDSSLFQSPTVVHKCSRFADTILISNLGVWPNFRAARRANVGTELTAMRRQTPHVPTALSSTVAFS